MTTKNLFSKKRLHLSLRQCYNLLKNKEVFMDIVSVDFEETLTLIVQGQKVQIIAFKTQEHGNIKFGVQAPRAIQVHREEIYYAIKQKEQNSVLEP